MSGMAETKKRSIRVSDEVWRALNALPGTVDEALAGLMSDNAGQAQPPTQDHRLDEVLELVQTMAEQTETIFEAVQKRKQAISENPLTAGSLNHCAHCDKDYPRPAGQQPTSMCMLCRVAGHWNTGNCRPCAEVQHLAEVAAGDQTGAERNDIVYDA